MKCFNDVIDGHLYLLEISKVDNDEIFKDCLYYWENFTKSLHKERNFNQQERNYDQILSDLAFIVILKMTTPEEIQETIDENRIVNKIDLKETDSVHLFKSMEIILMNLNYVDTGKKIISLLRSQNQLTPNKLNSLCWSIGCITKIMNEKDELEFLNQVINSLFKLLENSNEKEKVIITCNILYVFGHFPRAMTDEKVFIYCITRIFYYMHSKTQEIKGMACKTFLNISKKCPSVFTQKQPNKKSYLEEKIIVDIDNFISDLEDHQKQMFYEAIAYMIKTEQYNQEKLISLLMLTPNRRWNEINNDPYSIRENSFLKYDIMSEIENILKLNYSISKALQKKYISQFKLIYSDVLKIYKGYNKTILIGIEKGDSDKKIISKMKSIKKQILLLIESFIEISNNVQHLIDNYFPSLFSNILKEFEDNTPELKDPLILSIFTTCISKFKSYLFKEIPFILERVVNIIIPLIKNETDYPELLINFFKFLSSIIKFSFENLLNINPNLFNSCINLILWACKHVERNISEIGLVSLKELIDNIDKTKESDQFIFYKAFYLQILRDMWDILTDTFHVSFFDKIAEILYRLFSIINRYSFQFSSEKKDEEYILENLSTLIITGSPHINFEIVKNFIKGLLIKNKQQFINHLYDFLVESKYISRDKNEKSIIINVPTEIKK